MDAANEVERRSKPNKGRDSQSVRQGNREGKQMSKAKDATEALIAVKWIVENIGWNQGSAYLDKAGRARECRQDINTYGVSSCCLLGALSLVEENGGIYSPTDDAEVWLEKLIAPWRLLEWNDRPGRTKKQVLSLLTCAIRESSTKKAKESK
jgi:hypothetical protein